MLFVFYNLSVIFATCAMRATSWTRTTRAPRSIPSATVAAVRPPLFGQRDIQDRADELFPRCAEYDRSAERSKSSSRSRIARLCSSVLPNPDPRVDGRLFPSTPALAAILDPLLEIGHDLADYIVIDEVLLHIRRGDPLDVHDDHGSAGIAAHVGQWSVPRAR